MSATAAPSASALYDRPTPGYGSRVAHAIAVLQSAAAEHSTHIVQATSLGAEDMVITDLISRHHLGIGLATLDTGKLHAETLALITRIEQHYAVNVERFAPAPGSVIEFVRLNGEDAFYKSVELRKACCALRKLEPLERMLAGKRAWLTGLRREQSGARGGVLFSERDPQGRVKINPLADWAWTDVWHYISTHGVPYNPLHDQFMPSIGCAPCTRAIAVGEDFRSGRWWWEQGGAKECGLHTQGVEPSAKGPEA